MKYQTLLRFFNILSSKYLNGLLFVHQFAILIGKKLAAVSDKELLECLIAIRGIDVATHHIVREKSWINFHLGYFDATVTCTCFIMHRFHLHCMNTNHLFS